MTTTDKHLLAACSLSIWWSLWFCLPLAAFIAASPFYAMDHSLWLRINNVLVVATLAGVSLLGWKLRSEPWLGTAAAILCYTAVLVTLFMTAYLTTTWFFADRMKWIPLFHRDYLYHNHPSVSSYLFTGDNYVQLVQLHLFSWAVFSLAYLALGGLSAAFSRWQAASLIRFR